MSDTPHIVKSYAQDLQRLRELLTEMGGIVESQVAQAVQAIIARDPDLATQAVQRDREVDGLERQAETFVIRMLALRQPMASDLRQIVSTLKVASGLERIGDYAKNVAKRSMVLGQTPLPFNLTGLASMARLVQENLRLVLDAVTTDNAEQAVQVWQADQAVDDLYNSIFRELITYMMEDPRNISPCTHLLFVIRNLERIGDHSTNIAETVYYTATGQVLEDERPRGSESGAYAVFGMKDEAGA